MSDPQILYKACQLHEWIAQEGILDKKKIKNDQSQRLY